MEHESYTVREASRALGFSVPTVIRMCEEGKLQHFVSPGGHRRIPAEALEAVRTNGRAAQASSIPARSNVLQARQDRILELNLDGQELRARKELRRLQEEEAEETERRTAEERAREVERDERREQSKTGRARQEREFAQEQAEALRASLRQKLLSVTALSLPTDLSAERRGQLLKALENEFMRCGVEDEASAVLAARAVISPLVASWSAEDRAARQRKRMGILREDALRRALWKVGWARGSTESEKVEAATAIRAALDALAGDRSKEEIESAALAAITPILNEIERRQAREERINRGVQEIFPYLERLHRAGGISRETLTDFSVRRELECAVRRGLSAELASEDPGALRCLVQGIVDAQLDDARFH